MFDSNVNDDGFYREKREKKGINFSHCSVCLDRLREKHEIIKKKKKVEFDYVHNRNYIWTKWTTKKTKFQRYRILSSIENIPTFDEWIDETKKISLFTLGFVENQARRNKMFVSVWNGNAVVTHGWHLTFRVRVHVSHQKSIAALRLQKTKLIFFQNEMFGKTKILILNIWFRSFHDAEHDRKKGHCVNNERQKEREKAKTISKHMLVQLNRPNVSISLSCFHGCWNH